MSADPDAVDVAGLPEGWEARIPVAADLPALLELRRSDQQPYTGSPQINESVIEGEIMGPASWTRRQLVFVDPQSQIKAWAIAHDRAAGRTLIYLYVDRQCAQADLIAEVAYRWIQQAATELSELKGVDQIRLDASPFQMDALQQGWLSDAGYQRRRVWLHLERPVSADEVTAEVREGVLVRQVEAHENGLPVAGDLHLVHEVLERSFEDHFNSYRESFPEFLQRLREDPGHRWDHWWLAFVEIDGKQLPAGALVCSVQPAGESGREGSYVDYIGVNRLARGRGVAKSLLSTVIADAAERGRDRVGLEVDQDSPTKADELYFSLGWQRDYATESWFCDFEV